MRAAGDRSLRSGTSAPSTGWIAVRPERSASRVERRSRPRAVTAAAPVMTGFFKSHSRDLAEGHDRGVSAEREGVGKRGAHALLPGHVRNDVEVALGVLLLPPDRRRDEARL